MFFILSKILSFIISPIVWIFGLLVYSFITKLDKRAKKLRYAAVIVLYLTSNSFLVDELFRAYEPVTPDVDLTSEVYDGGIVLGGIGNIDMRLNKINFTYSSDRLFQAIKLLEQKRIKRLIFTGGSGSIEFPEKKEGLYVYKYLTEIRIPDSLLIMEYQSKNTYENAIFTKPIIDSLNKNGRYLLITSSFHMPRALAVFKKAGFTNLQPYPTNKNSGIRRYTFDHLFIPNVDAMFSLQILLHEWIGYLVYKIKGYA